MALDQLRDGRDACPLAAKRQADPKDAHPTKRFKEKAKARQPNSTLAIRIEALDWMKETSRSQKAVAEEFNGRYPHLSFTQPLICAWCKQENNRRERYNKNVNEHALKRSRRAKSPAINDALELWAQQGTEDGMILSGLIL